MAGKSVTFLRGKSDEEVAHYFKSSLAFIFPGVDDFGIVAVEALAAGTQVIAYKDGGALDYVNPGQTGLFFEPQTTEALTQALEKFSSQSFNHASITKTAETFDAKHFRSTTQDFINKCLTAKTS